MERHFRRLLGVLAALLLLAGAITASRAAASRLLFRGARADAGGLAIPPDFALITASAGDGIAVHALHLPATRPGWTVVHFHNNRDTAADGADLARALHARGFGVLLVEYRGYGLSGGAAPSEEGLYADAEAALAGLAGTGVHADRVVLWGASLGTGVAAEMARRARGAALVLVTPYTSIPDVVHAAAPFAPAELLSPDRFDTLDKAPSIHVPTLVVHGDADGIVPFWMGTRLAAAIAGAQLVRIAGGHHGDLFLRERERILDALGAMVRGGS